MDILQKTIKIINKEEGRFYKLLASRTNSNKERKDVVLFDYIKKHNKNYNEQFICQKLYKNNKNAFYQLKNRLFKDLNKSMMLQHLAKEQDIHILQSILLSRIYKQKKDIDLAFYFLKKAENNAFSNEAFEFLTMIYSEIIKLSYDMVAIDVEAYIIKQKENKKKLDQIEEIDRIIAVVMYRIKTAQNFSGKNEAVLNVLENVVNEFAKNKDIPKSPKFQFKIYQAISRILLQKHDFYALEEYLLHTYKIFSVDKIFNKKNHDHKLTILTYLTNCLYKTHKLKKSLKFAEILKQEMQKYEGFLSDKFLFYYYNALIINYSILDKDKALKILGQAQKDPIIKNLPTYTVFIYLNTALIYFDKREYLFAIKNLSRLLLHDDFNDIGKAFQLKIELVSLIIRYELDDFEIIEKRTKVIRNIYKNILFEKEFERDIQLLEIISKLIYCKNLIQDINLVSKINNLISKISDEDANDADIINYNIWLKNKL